LIFVRVVVYVAPVMKKTLVFPKRSFNYHINAIRLSVKQKE